LLTPVAEQVVEHYRAIEGLARSSASEEFRALGRLVRRNGKSRG
jgi:hypothetical protein